jgi:hypothetical protein
MDKPKSIYKCLISADCRVVMATDRQTRPSITFDKALVRQIRVNAMLTSDRVKRGCFVHGGYHVAATLDGWM